MADLRAICRRFTRFMHDGVRAVRNAEFNPKPDARIDKLVVFYGLERCRDLIPAEGRPVRCRFSLGPMPEEEQAAHVRTALNAIRGFHFLEEGLTTLSLYLVDFSFSAYTRDQLLGPDPLPGGGKFELLLAAESEMHRSHAAIYEDFMKLIDVKCAIKVMIYPARTPDIGALVAGFEQILQRHRRYEPQAEPAWLFVGIPGYAEWIANADKPDPLVRQVHTIEPAQAPYHLVPKPDWWAWEPADAEI